MMRVRIFRNLMLHKILQLLHETHVHYVNFETVWLVEGFLKMLLHLISETDLQIIIKVFGLIKYFLSNKILTSPILTLDAN